DGGSVSSDQSFMPGAEPPGFWPRPPGNSKPERSRVMSRATVFIFAPVEEARDSHRKLEAEGCELRLRKASWDTPLGNSAPGMIGMTPGAPAPLGTSLPHA